MCKMSEQVLEQDWKNLYIKQSRQMEQLKHQMRNDFFSNLLAGRIPTEDCLSKMCEQLGLEFEGDYFAVLKLAEITKKNYFSIRDEQGMTPEEKHLLDTVAYCTVKECLNERYEVYVLHDPKENVNRSRMEHCFLIHITNLDSMRYEVEADQIMLWIKKRAEKGLAFLNNKMHVTYYSGLSSVYGHVSSIAHAFREAEKMLEYGSLKKLERKAVTYFDVKLPEHKSENQKSFNLEKRFSNSLVSYDYKGASEIMQEIVDCYVNSSISTMQNLKPYLNSHMERVLLLQGIDVSPDVEINEELEPTIDKEIQQLFFSLIVTDDAESLKTKINEIFLKIEQKKEQETKGGLPEEIEQYIRENYQNTELGAVMICEAFSISGGYLSRMFKEKTGCGVLEYIHRVRIEKIKWYLEHTDKKVEEIASCTGFYNRLSMTRTFKRYENMTPSVYRENQ